MTPIEELHALVIESSLQLPTGRRARIYRALASIIGNEATALRLEQMALDLDNIDRRSRQMLLDLSGERSAS